MPGSEIEALIEELENSINNAKTPLSGGGSKKIVDANQIYDILDDLKRNIPEEFMKARRILRERDQLLDSAEVEADQIVSDAREQASMMASQQEVIRLAKKEAEDIKRQAESEAREIRFWAEDSAEKTFAKLEELMRIVMDTTDGLLGQMGYCRDLLAGVPDDPEMGMLPEDDQRHVQA